MKPFSVGLLLILTSAANAQVTLEDFQRAQESASPRVSEAFAAYSNGLLDGITWTHSLAGEGGLLPFCLPSNLELNRVELESLVYEYSEKLGVDPSTTDFGLVSVFALQDAFPCSR